VSARAARATALAAALGVAVALLVSACGGSSAKLIPVADASSLQNDFETVAQTAESAEGDCAPTERALQKTEQDFAALPASVDAGLRDRLREGITKLRQDAMGRCAQRAAKTSSSTQSKTQTTKTQPAKTTPTTTSTSTSGETQPTTSTPAPTPSTPAPGAGSGGGVTVPEEPASGSGAGGTGAGEAEEGAGEGAAGATPPAGATPGAGGPGRQE